MPLLTAPATHHHHHHHHHLHHHHHPLLLTFMGSGTGANSGSGSSSSSNSPPPVIKTEPKDLPEEGEEVPPQPPPPSSPLSSGSPGQPRSPPVGLLNHRHLVGDEKLVVATLASLQHSGDPSHLIKQDLRLIIQSRRKAEGKGELQVDFQAPPKDEVSFYLGVAFVCYLCCCCCCRFEGGVESRDADFPLFFRYFWPDPFSYFIFFFLNFLSLFVFIFCETAHTRRFSVIFAKVQWHP